MKALIARSLCIRGVGFTGLFVLASLIAVGQDCNECPALNSCGTCLGGLTGLTLQFNGSVSGLITASDLSGNVFSGVIVPDETFSFIGSLPNQKFQGSTIELRVDGNLNATISSNCGGSTFVSSIFGDFTVIAGMSKDGGALCCSEASMENIPPVISDCPATITASLPPSSCTVAVSWSSPSAVDNCTLESLVSTHLPGSIFPIGITEVVYTALDIYGNTSTCSFMIVVEDKTIPIISGCPSDILTSANGTCDATVSWALPSASDNCSVTLTSTHNSGDLFTFGTTAVTYTATDPSGNVATCTFNVMVENNGDPAITGCPTTITMNANEDGEVVVQWNEPQATVACGALSVTKSHEPGSTFMVGTTAVVYEFTDETGQSATCTFDVIVQMPEIEFTVSKVVTPDGDGIHDTWKLENMENFERNTVVIVDRWGNKIYQATGYDNENVFWDGTNGNGTKVPTGTYFYTIEVRFQDNIVKRTGYLEVIQ